MGWNRFSFAKLLPSYTIIGLMGPFLRSLTFADGDTVSGHILKEHISIGGLEAG